MGAAAGDRSSIDITRAASGDIEGNLDAKGYQEAQKRIIGEIPDPTFGYLRGSSAGVSEERRCFSEQLDRLGFAQSSACRPLREE